MTHLKFDEELSKTGKTKRINVSSAYDGTNLGVIEWCGRWWQYVFAPTLNGETIWSSDCLVELNEKVKECNIESRKKKVIAKDAR